MANSLFIRIERKDLAALAQQVHEVPAIAAAGVEHPHLRRNVPAQNLVEHINIDLPKLLLDTHREAHPGCFRPRCLGQEISPRDLRLSRSITLGGTMLDTSPPSTN